ncbi:hypothetical protein Hanom_Chr01g00062121 [Helianthus anomalus]
MTWTAYVEKSQTSDDIDCLRGKSQTFDDIDCLCGKVLMMWTAYVVVHVSKN